jgi:hypothetical protein
MTRPKELISVRPRNENVTPLKKDSSFDRHKHAAIENACYYVVLLEISEIFIRKARMTDINEPFQVSYMKIPMMDEEPRAVRYDS